MPTTVSTALLELLAVLIWIAIVNYTPSTSSGPLPADMAKPKAATILETPGEWDPELLAHEARRRERHAAAARPSATRASSSSSSSSDSSASRSSSRASSGRFHFHLPKIRIGRGSDDDEEEVLRD